MQYGQQPQKEAFGTIWNSGPRWWQAVAFTGAQGMLGSHGGEHWIFGGKVWLDDEAKGAWQIANNKLINKIFILKYLIYKNFNVFIFKF